jgi:hypothetical protein
MGLNALALSARNKEVKIHRSRIRRLDEKVIDYLDKILAPAKRRVIIM